MVDEGLEHGGEVEDVFVNCAGEYYYVVDIGFCERERTQNVVDSSLDVGRRVSEAHHRNFEDFLSSMRHDGKAVLVVVLDAPLVEKGTAVDSGNEFGSSYCGYDVALERHRIDVWDRDLV